MWRLQIQTQTWNIILYYIFIKYIYLFTILLYYILYYIINTKANMKWANINDTSINAKSLSTRYVRPKLVFSVDHKVHTSRIYTNYTVSFWHFESIAGARHFDLSRLDLFLTIFLRKAKFSDDLFRKHKNYLTSFLSKHIQNFRFLRNANFWLKYFGRLSHHKSSIRAAYDFDTYM